MPKNGYFLKFIYSYKKQILSLFALSLFSSSFFLAGPYFSKLFIDTAFLRKDFAKFLNLSIIGAAIFLFSVLGKTAEDIVKNKIGVKTNLLLANGFMKRLYSLDLKFFNSRSVGENLYRFFDIERVTTFLLEQCPQFLVDIFKLLIMLGVSFWINSRMTVFLLILSPLFLMRSIYIQGRLKAVYEQMWKANAALYKEISEAFSKILVIKAFGWERYKVRSYLKLFIRNTRCKIESFRWGIIASLVSSFLSKTVYGAVSLYGGWLIIKGNLTIGSYTAVMIYIVQVGVLLESLSHRLEFLAQEAVSLDRFIEIMKLSPAIKDSPRAVVLKKTKGGIYFNNVWFGYERERPLFKGLTFNIPEASRVAIVGPSGCGKTTLVNLILRLYDPWQGDILLDGLDLRDIKLESLRNKIAIATQQPLLFDVSIADNISYGLKDISEDRIKEVAKIVCIDDFIVHLPEGYNTVVGEDANFLSQGLKQRLAIGRAVLRNPAVLILDEASSSVDFLTEEKIFKNLKQLRAGLATIIISHRLSSIRDMDKIYFLAREGEITGGTHSYLLSQNPTYKEFFHNQTEVEISNI